MTAATASEAAGMPAVGVGGQKGGPGASVAYIDTLTPLRGIAALWIVVLHYDYLVARLAPPSFQLISHGYLWVDFFFILSGFVICHVYGRQLSDQPLSRSFWPYMKARFSRLYPIHLVTLLLMMGMWYGAVAMDPTTKEGVPPDVFSLSTVPQNLLLVHAHGTTPDNSWNFPSWSIAAEWWTYVAAAFFIPLLYRRPLKAGLLVGIVGFAGLALLEQWHPKHNLNIDFDFGWLRCLLGFLVGVALYELYWRKQGGALATDAFFLCASALMLAVMALSPVDALLIPFFALVILAAARNEERTRRVLSAGPLKYLGELSYSIYMLHTPCLFIVWSIALTLNATDGFTDGYANPGLPYVVRLAFLAASLALTIGASALSYRYIEVPSRKWLRRKLA